MLQVSEKEVKSRLAFDNPWWSGSNSPSDEFRLYPKRAYLESFHELVTQSGVNRAVILMGPRRVGKTVMIYHTIQRLLDQGVNGQDILYMSLETPVYTNLSLEQLLQLFAEQFGHSRDKPLYIFFDEIQYLRDWEIHLKSLVDSYPRWRFVATGSAAAALKLKSAESGAGRFTDFMLPPLTFSEYLYFIGEEEKLISPDTLKSDKHYHCSDIVALNNEFINYLNFGGYPEAVFSSIIQKDTSRYIKADIIDKVLSRDLPSLYGIPDVRELNVLFTTLAYNTGNEVNLEGLAKASGVAKNTLRKYLDYLEAAFLIRRVHRVDQNAHLFKRVTYFKVYLTNPTMRTALFGPVHSEHEAMGALTETAIFSQWLHSTHFIEQIYYARWGSGKEIDIVGLDKIKQRAVWLTEVKWSDKYYRNPSELKALYEFSAKHELMRIPLVTTRTQEKTISYNNVEIEFTPSSLHCYTIGKNVLKT